MRPSMWLPVFLSFAAAWSSAPFAGEEERALLKALSAQVDALRQQLEKANARIGDLEKKLATAEGAAAAPAKTVVAPPAHAAATAKPAAVSAGDVKGTVKIPGSETSLGFGGFVKLDALFNSVSAGRDRLGDQQLVVGQIPLRGAAGEHGQIVVHAKESRLWFKSFTPSRLGDIDTYLELDFFADPGTFTYTPRLRHAYGSLGHFLVGQTWTTFLNVAALPDTLDVGGSAGALGPLRQPLIRWHQPFTWGGTFWEWQWAVEAPRTRLWLDPRYQDSADGFGLNTPGADRYPDVIARLNLTPSWGSLSLSSLARHIRYTHPTGWARQSWGGAVSLAGRIDIGERDNLRFMLSHGDVLGRYAATNAFADAALDGGGRLRLLNTHAAMVAYQHWWSPQWRTNVVYGYGASAMPDSLAANLTEQAQSVHVNLLWSPILQTTLGVEYLYATRDVVDGRSGVLHRVQFSSRFNF